MEEKKEIRAAIMKFHDRMFDTFQKMPPKIILVMRNLNTIRSIVTLHKSGVDRFRVMARVAVSGRLRGALARVMFQVPFKKRKLARHLFSTMKPILDGWSQMHFRKGKAYNT